MARQRIHNSRAGRGGGSSGTSWISYSDLMCALLLVFVLMLSMILYQYVTMMETKTAELDQQKLLITDQQLKLDEQTLQIAAQQVTMDHQSAQIAIIMTELDEKQSALEEAYIILGDRQAELEAAYSTLAGKEEQLIILQSELKKKEDELNAAVQVLKDQQAALDSQTDKIEDMVGMKAEIIAELSASLAASDLSAAVDPNTGDIVLDSAVLFKTGSSSIMSEGKYLLDYFIPIYLEVLLRPEYADYMGQIIIEGHTDDDGTWENNMKLSQERAYEVMMYVLSMYPDGTEEKELLQKLLTATGRSETDLIYYEGTDIVDKAASRRVEFKFSLKDAEMIEEINRLLQSN